MMQPRLSAKRVCWRFDRRFGKEIDVHSLTLSIQDLVIHAFSHLERPSEYLSANVGEEAKITARLAKHSQRETKSTYSAQILFYWRRGQRKQTQDNHCERMSLRVD